MQRLALLRRQQLTLINEKSMSHRAIIYCTTKTTLAYIFARSSPVIRSHGIALCCSFAAEEELILQLTRLSKFFVCVVFLIPLTSSNLIDGELCFQWARSFQCCLLAQTKENTCMYIFGYMQKLPTDFFCNSFWVTEKTVKKNLVFSELFKQDILNQLYKDLQQKLFFIKSS